MLLLLLSHEEKNIYFHDLKKEEDLITHRKQNLIHGIFQTYINENPCDTALLQTHVFTYDFWRTQENKIKRKRNSNDVPTHLVFQVVRVVQWRITPR